MTDKISNNVLQFMKDRIQLLAKRIGLPPFKQPEELPHTVLDNPPNTVEIPAPPLTTSGTKECPFCAELILVQARKCKHCGEFLDKTAEPTRKPDMSASTPERTEYEDHPAMFRNKPFAFIVTLALCLVGVGLIILLIWWIRILGTTLTVTTKRTILRRGLLSKFTSEVYHKDVRNVQVTQTAFQRLFDVGTIEISSAGQSDFEIAVEGMYEPNRVKHIIDDSRAA